MRLLLYFKYYYNKLRLKYNIWLLKRLGKKYGLPSLEGYSDEAIAEGFRRLKNGTKTN